MNDDQDDDNDDPHNEIEFKQLGASLSWSLNEWLEAATYIIDDNLHNQRL